MTAAIVATDVSKRYGKTLALDGCSLTVEEGRIVALVGPNGAGKTTLLHLTVGLLRPTSGTLSVLGQTPIDGQTLDMGFVAQNAPLYDDFTARDHLTMAGRLNDRFDMDEAVERVASLDIPLDRKVEKLSGGQRAQIALTLALAKRPALLLLDEPVANLDPLARREFLQLLVSAVAESQMTVVLSSHLIADLERVCDHLIVLNRGHVQVAGDVDEVMDSHRILIGPARASPEIAGVGQVISASTSGRQSNLLVRTTGQIVDPAWDILEVSLEDIVLAYLARPESRSHRTTDLTWLVWRQHRLQLLFGVAALAIIGAFFLLSGLPIHDNYETSGVADCLPEAMKHEFIPAVDITRVGSPDITLDLETLDPDVVAAGHCAQSANEFYDPYQWVIFTGLLLLVLPMLVGMFWGAPLVARELEHGTNLLVWTQGVTRRRWAVSKIALVTLGVLALTGIYTAMNAWWINPVALASGQRFGYVFFDIHGYVFFDIHGYVVIGYTLFALALGIYAGSVTRRTPSAMAATLVGFLALRLVMMIGVRPRMLPTEQRLLQGVSEGATGADAVPMTPNLLHGDWVIERVEQVANVSTVETFHPASQFWTMQGIETAVFLIVALIFIVLAIRRITTKLA